MWITLQTIVLLSLSNIVMTFAWYGHLKFFNQRSLLFVIMSSWGIAFFEYCIAVPANRYAFGAFSGFQLKVLQEAITIVVFSIFAIFVLNESFRWNYIVSFALILGAAFFAFGFDEAR